MYTLALIFFVIALLYSMVGFGGGTSYIAALAMAGIPYILIPKISLLCNLLVISGGCWHFYRAGHLNRKLAIPFVVSSVPLAFLGGRFPITEKIFYILLTVSLCLCGLRLLLVRDRAPGEIKRPGMGISLLIGGALGLLSGMVGIGGGIFLSPVLINMGWARSKEAAAVASMFIFLNSLAGLVGQFSKELSFPEPSLYLPLFFAVIIGGQIGSRLGTNTWMSYRLIQKGTGILTLFIGARLLFKNLF